MTDIQKTLDLLDAAEQRQQHEARRTAHATGGRAEVREPRQVVETRWLADKLHAHRSHWTTFTPDDSRRTKMLPDMFDSPQSAPAQLLAELGARRRELLAQEREALAALDVAQAEHARLARVVADDEAKALVLGEEPKVNKGAQIKVAKLATEADEHGRNADRFGAAVVALDDETRRVVMENACELLSEAVDQHNAARERITQLVSELHERQAELRVA